MADKPIPIGTRLTLVDPNNFDDQYSGGIFGNPNYNMSVPQEDLSITVELKTTTKARTILTTQNDISLSITTGDNVKKTNIVKVNFIDGSTDATTGNQDYLTTKYTELSTDLTDIDETLGITSIDIDFNSSYAPMVHINFIDIRGGSIFQNGGKSKYNVFFKLPYPIFELTIKGFYGKPVKYCLHMTKCNSKFNSQTGNFEIAANFVGYTYAMLSDMIIGYLKAAAETPRGKELLKARGVPSINEFLQSIANIDSLVKGQLLNSSDEDTNNLAIINDLRQLLESMRQEITTTTEFKFRYDKYEVPDPLKESIAIIRDPNANGTALNDIFADTDNNSVVNTFTTNFNNLVKDYNTKAGTLTNLQILDTNLTVKSIITTPSSVKNNRPFVYDKIYQAYSISQSNTGAAEAVISRLKSASSNIANDDNGWVRYYDFTDLINVIDSKLVDLTNKQNELTKFVALRLKNLITTQLGFDTSIRSIFKLFTTHVEIFLQQIFEVSAKYKDDLRTKELSKFVKSKNTDISSTSDVIYPWPEYNENNKEKYLGSKSVLANPLNVPEVNFVEQIYQGMLVSGVVSQTVTNTITNPDTSWNAFNPVDSGFFTDNKNPYSRLPDSATHDDVARLAVLRAVGFMGYSNTFLTPDEIKNFATNESNLIISKFTSADNRVINLLGANYDTPDKFAKVTGTINSAVTPVLLDENSDWEYVYIYPNNRRILPVSSGFTNVTYTVPTAKDTTSETDVGGFILSNVNSKSVDKEDVDDASYVTIIERVDYDNKTVNLVPNVNQSVFSFDVMKLPITSSAQITSAGFVANNGNFGVQDFKKIQYNGFSTNSPYYTLFYNDGDLLSSKQVVTGPVAHFFNLDSIFNKSLLFPSICKLRKATAGQNGQPYSTPFDINTTIKLPFTIDNQQNDYNLATDKVSYGMIGSIYRNRDGIGRNIALLSSAANNLNSTLFSFPFLNFGVATETDTNLPLQGLVSLFGSRFYNAQETTKAKAFLFLHSFPWRGLVSQEPRNAIFSKTVEIGVFRQDEILNSFQNRTGFVQVPRLWPAFIGALLWRYREGKAGRPDPILFKSKVNNEFLIPTFVDYSGDYLPKTDEYITQITSKDTVSAAMNFDARWVIGGVSYAKLEDTLKFLPLAVQNTFINEFQTFVTNEYETTRKNFEIIPVGATSDHDDAAWIAAWNNINNATTVDDNNNATVSLATIQQFMKVKNSTNDFKQTFNVFSYTPEKDFYSKLFRYNYFLEYSDDANTSPAIVLKNLFADYKYISNDSYLIWNSAYNTADAPNAAIRINKSDFSTYMNALMVNVKNTVTANEKKKFNNNELEEIKLEIYRTIKKLYDKWVGFSDNANAVMFQCCKTAKDRLPTDAANNTLNGGDGKTLNLIDSFRFVTRSFKDIGDDFQINPIIISKLLLDDTNISFYDLISRILTDNNFDFVALPSFVNYNDPIELRSIFKPYPYYESANIASSGPSFVCVYIGQTSTKLDFGKGADYPNDSFDLTGNPPILPPDFGTPKQPWEDTNAAFVVRYGHQNQNIFRDIILDQSEFGETAESLQITDNIANRLSDTNKSYIGQNLYNVYSVRSYKTEVEMMGNAMIQPMMYFQLENIPMFHGAYLITKVKHTIKPNSMKTNFTGTRIKAIETPILDAAALYSALLDSFELPSSKEGTTLTNTVTSIPPIVRTLMSNGASNANVDKQGNITLSPISLPIGIKNNISDTPKLLTEAINPLNAMLKEWITWMKANGFAGNGGNYAFINSAFRTIAQQQAIRNAHPTTSAPVGSSNHGWGIAFDFQFLTKAGVIIPNYVDNKANITQGYDFDVNDPNSNQALIWLLDNSYRFGFIIPLNLRDGVGLEEFWHFEYHGKSAACILSKNPNIHGHVVSVDKPYDASVVNPKNPDGTVAVYDAKNCDYEAVKIGDGSNVLSTKLSKQELADNQKIVKDFLKNYFQNTLKLDTGLAKVLTAGVMGNIQKESGFNQTIKHLDTNGRYSYGLIQWNEGTYPDMFNKLGISVISEMTKLVDGYTPLFQSFVTQARAVSGLNSYTAAFLFAKIVEICTFCYKTIDIYNADTKFNQSDRSKFADDFFNRFNSTTDPLVW